MASLSQGQILVDMPVMQHQSCLEGGWAWAPCFLFVVGILKETQLIMNLGLLAKRSVSNLVIE